MYVNFEVSEKRTLIRIKQLQFFDVMMISIDILFDEIKVFKRFNIITKVAQTIGHLFSRICTLEIRKIRLQKTI